jgi:hypothetical protein
MVKIRISEVILYKFNVCRVSTSGNYIQKWISKLYNY